MLMNLRNALMAGKRLPYDAEVEYLGVGESHPYINTGIPGNLPWLKIELGCYYSTFARPYAAILGNYIGESYNVVRLILQDRDNNIAYGGANSTATPAIAVAPFSKNQWHNVVIETNNRTVISDGIVYGPGNIGSENSSPVYLFRSGPNGTASFTSARISCFKAWQNNILVRDFIPVRKGTVGYLYDRVSGKLFGNAGTGDFVLGPDVVPVEWLESSGTQWIDTGVMSSRCYGAYLDFKAIDFASYMFFVCNATADDFCVGTNANSTANPYIGRIRRSLWYSGSIDKTAFVALSCKGGKILLNGVEKGVYDDTLPLAQNDNTIRMFGLSGSSRLSKSAIRRFDLYSSSQEAIFKASPIRVGSGSTWEGAMMDVLTRRVYRNAGTGAFTYGNDLKYPIPAE